MIAAEEKRSVSNLGYKVLSDFVDRRAPQSRESQIKPKSAAP